MAAGFEPGQESRFSLPDPGSKPTGIVSGADGALWVAESNGHAIVRMQTDGTTTRYAIPSGANPTDLAAGADGTIWWVAAVDNSYGRITPQGALEEWEPPVASHPAAVAVASDGSGWFIKPGAFYKLDAMRSSANPTGFQGLIEIGHGVSSPTSIEAIGGKIWVSDSAANLIVVFSETGVYERSISIPSPSAMTAGDGGVYVVSASSGIIKVNLDGTPAFNEWQDPGFPLISDVVVPAPGEQWFSELRGRQVTVRSQVPGIPETVGLPDAGGPSDLTVGPDGAIWYTAQDTAEVVRIARDYEAPGAGFPNPQQAPHLFAYVGEPLGPVVENDRGSGIVRTVISGTLPSGVVADPSHPDTLVGIPTARGSSDYVVTSKNTYYGGVEATIERHRTLFVRDRPNVTRIGGADRYESAVNASKSSFTGGAPKVYLASGETFADALSAGAVAIASNAPLLLTTRMALPPATAGELARLKPSKVIVIGGPATISDGVIDQVSAISAPGTNVTRVGGADRYDVSLKLAQATDSGPSIYLASGLNYPDALAASPVAGAANRSVLLVNGALDRLPDATMAFLLARPFTSVRLAGGSASVSEGIRMQVEAAGIPVTRLGGADRYETATLINRDVIQQPGIQSRTKSNPVTLTTRSTIYLASGENYPDALAGGVSAGLSGAPLYVTPKSCVPRPVLLDIGSSQATKVVVLGGPNTLAVPVESLTVCP